MSERAVERHDELDRVATALLRCANRGVSRLVLLREASQQIMPLLGARRIVLWAEDGDLRYRWDAALEPQSSFVLRGWANRGDGLAREAEAVLAECPEASAVLQPFAIDGRNQGALLVETHEAGHLIGQRRETCESVAQLLGAAVASRRAHAALTERVKELTCMYRIAQIGADAELPLEAIMQQVVELLPNAWQYPEIATARIALGAQRFESSGFDVGPYRLSADVAVNGSPVGLVEVFYREAGPNIDDAALLHVAPFLAEEQYLMAGVAREIGTIIERKRDREEKERLHEQLRHADRLATIGQLAAGVAHELNEPLGNILGFAQLAAKGPELAAQSRSDLDRIVTASLYAREVIKKLMLFSRQTAPRRSAVDINRIVEESLALVESRCAKAAIAIERRLASALSPVEGDAAQLQQVLVNLVVNSIQAMPDGGSLTVATRETDSGVFVSVADTGVGIAAEHLDNIFVPFFTTKGVGQGTGLGLSVVHGIVRAHGGTVEVRSRPGQGACFDVRLPALREGNPKEDAS